MAPAANPSSALRRRVAAALLLVVALSMSMTLSPAEVARRAALFWRSLSGEAIPPGRQTAFWFDPDYAAFLEEVRRRTPSNATIAIVVPPWPDVYVYQAAYQLAPRRVVPQERRAEASWVAAYRQPPAKSPDPNAIAVANGALIPQ